MTQTQVVARESLLARAILVVLRLYQATALLRRPHCRFHPTCSQYAMDAVRIHGAVRGTGLSIRRLARCHPWNPGGIDPVEPRKPT
jgi:putative membrane protein insertion efficiency factor